MNKAIKAVLVLFALALLAGGAYVLIVLWPWLAGPGEPAAQIEARYQAMERWANFPTQPKSHPGLVSALEAVEKNTQQLGERFKKIEGQGLPQIDAEALGPEAEQALSGLVAWSTSETGLSDKRCPDIGRPISMLTLGRLALVTAPDDAASPQVQAVLALAAECRRHGLLIHQMVGLVLAEEAIQWCRDRKLEPGPAFAQFAPKKEEVYSGLVRESICMVDLTEKEIGSRGEETKNLDAGAPLGANFVMDRELLWIKKYNADLFEALRPVSKDLGALAAGLKTPGDEELPPSFLIRLSAPQGLPGIVQRMAGHIETYERLLKKPVSP